LDPLAGSYFIEALTNELEEGAMNYIGTIESLGSGEWKMLYGMIKGIETGFFPERDRGRIIHVPEGSGKEGESRCRGESIHYG